MTPSLPAAAALVIVMLGSPVRTEAQTGDRVADAVKPGETVSIVDDNGRRIDGRVEAVSDYSIRVSIRKASKDIPMERIVRIEHPDTVKNGALSGLAVGLTLGLLGGVTTHVDNRGAFLATSLVGNGLLWTAIGTAVDAAFDNKRTLYQRGGRTHARLSPVVGPGVRGAAVALSW